MNRIISVLVLLCVVVITSTAQQFTVQGLVLDSISKQAVDGAVVRVFEGERMLGFDITNTKGEYKIQLNSSSASLLLAFQHLAFNVKLVKIVSGNRVVDAHLSSKEVLIREVMVKAPDIIVKQDTLSFNVASIKSASDRTIEDVIKKIPGVEVGSSGAIRFQGKAISTFHVEGMNLLGGRYNVATRNIEAADVNRVEVVENYQEVKQLEGVEFSDKVAMNLKLNDEAKLTLKTTYEAGAGFRAKEALYHGVVTGMVFGKKAQFIGTVKANNAGARLSDVIRNHFGSNAVYNVANNLLTGSLSSQPPLANDRFLHKNDLLATLNSVVKPSDDKSLRVNVDFNGISNRYRYSTNRSYYLNNSQVVVNEEHAPNVEGRLVNTSAEFEINNKSIYLKNHSLLSFAGNDQLYNLVSNAVPIGQHKASKLYGLTNNFTILRRNKKRQVEFNSVIKYSYLPDSRITFTGVPDVTGAFFQQSGGQSFFTKEAVSFGYDISSVSKLSIVADFRMDYDQINTLLQRGDSIQPNQNYGSRLVTSVWPVYRLLKEDQRFGFTIGFPVNMYNLNYRSQLVPGAGFGYHKPFFNAWMNAHYTLSPSVQIRFNAGHNNSIGDINDFIIHPVQRSYMTQTTRSGILSHSLNQLASLTVECKLPVNLFFSNLQVGYNNTSRNLLNNQLITSGNSTVGISDSGVAADNDYRSYSASGSVSKRFSALFTNVSLRSGYTYSTGMLMRNGVKQEMNNQGFSLSPSINTRIARKVEIDYSLHYNQNKQSSQSYTNSNRQQTHALKVQFNPVEKWFVYAGFDYNRFELSPGRYITMQFMDAGVRYKNKKSEIELKLNNLLNTREYAYTVFSDLDSFSYRYQLNPVSAIVLWKFRI